jgi:hypothetical protein
MHRSSGHDLERRGAAASRQSLRFLTGLCAAWSLAVSGAGRASAQLAPTGAHYAGRPSDTGHSPVSSTGGYAAAVPLDLPPARGGLPVPVAIAYGGRGVGAAGISWDVPISYVRRNTSIARRRPAHFPGDQIAAREQMVVSVGGQTIDMVRAGPVWVARRDAPDLELSAGADDSWTLRDGQGRVYVFTAPHALLGSDIWLLSSVSAAGDANRVDLAYEVAAHFFTGGSGIAIDLVSVGYNTHPQESGCTKDEIDLSYGPPSDEPLSLTLLDDLPLVRMRTLRVVDVRARESCSAAPERIRAYQLDYAADPDTGLPRLHAVGMLGREGSQSLPVAVYGYGAALVGDELLYQRGADVALPADLAGTPPIARTYLDPAASSPDGGQTSVTWQNLIDVSGDGRADLVYAVNDQLRVARNRPGGGSATTLAASLPLAGGLYSNRSLASQSSESARYDLGWQNHQHVWRQAIDVNGDGRIDVIDATEQADVWTIYLNTPGNPVTWVKRSWRVAGLRALLEDHGHDVEGDFLPLSRRTTGYDFKIDECWRWDEDHGWQPFPEGWSLGACTGAIVQERTSSEKTFTEWEISDINGDGYPDVVFNSSPVRNADWAPHPGGNLPPADRYLTVDAPHPLEPSLRNTNSILVVFNVAGVRFDLNTNPFSAPVGIEDFTACGVGLWRDDECPDCSIFSGSSWGPVPDTVPDEQFQVCGIEDVNGDGIPDRIENERVLLGSGTSFVNAGVGIRMPGPIRQLNQHETACATNQAAPYNPVQLSALRDLTGDGIPDFIERRDGSWRVAIGTGTGFTASRAIRVPTPKGFSISNTTENCTGGYLS